MFRGRHISASTQMPLTRLTRVDGTPKSPGQWTLVTAECKDRFPVVMACPKCGRLSSISSRVHMVILSGNGALTLSPKFTCSRCGWKAAIKNSNYTEVNA